MEQGRVRKYSRRERQGMTDQEYCTQDNQYENLYSTKDEEADCRDYGQRATESGRRFANAGTADRTYTCGTSGSRTGHGDSGIKVAWDYVSNSRIKVRKNGRTVAKVPASLGIAGVIGSIFNRRLAMVGAIGLASALSAGYYLSLDVEKPH